ncbi:MAG TPA: porin, partial [Actinomycetota bacterium]|nr:porin [Actinomycetota bacterium]
NAVWDSSTDTLSVGALPGPSLLGSAVGTTPTTLQGDYAAHRVPDIVGSLRVDQAWGSAQIAAALHEVRTGWYGNNVTGLQLGAPETKWGFAVLAGVNINLPWAKGDAFWVEGIYTQGALGYSGISQQNGQYGHFNRFNGANTVTGWGLDAIFGGTTALGVPIIGAPSSTELTTLWAINAALQHYWTPTLRTSIFGAYTEVDFNSTATQYFAGAGTVGPCRTLAGGVGTILAPLPGCDPDFRVYGAGIRTIWNPAPQFDIGLEVVWTRIESKMDANLVRLTFAGAGGRAPGLYIPQDQEVWSAIFRMQRNFWP